MIESQVTSDRAESNENAQAKSSKTESPNRTERQESTSDKKSPTNQTSGSFGNADIAERERRLYAVEANVHPVTFGPTSAQFKGEEGKFYPVRTDGQGGDTSITYGDRIKDQKLTFEEHPVIIETSNDNLKNEPEKERKEKEPEKAGMKEPEKERKEKEPEKAGMKEPEKERKEKEPEKAGMKEPEKAGMKDRSPTRFGEHIGTQIANSIDKSINEFQDLVMGEPKDSIFYIIGGGLLETFYTIEKGIVDILRVGKGLDDAKDALNDQNRDKVERYCDATKAVLEDVLRMVSIAAPISGGLTKSTAEAAAGQLEKAAAGQLEKAAAGQLEKKAALVGAKTDQMRREAARIIESTPGHPLKFLLDDSGKIKSSSRMGYHDMIDRPDIVEMGHIISKKSGETERIMLQGAWENRFNSVTAERPNLGAFVENIAVDIGGIAVDLKTAKFWESIGWLPKGTVNAAPIVK